MSITALIFFCSFLFSQENSYLYGVPPGPPYQKAEVTITISNKEGCNMAKEPMIGYIISADEGSFSDYKVVMQDQNGVRHKCYIDTDLTSNYDLSLLKYTLIPGNKVEMKVQYCGSGGFIYVMKIKNLKRT
ncbi:hypothetical protein EYD45_09395 [Hyunsoonleella flava]|uniref:Uncharacterized protein n=1 Tax=Hyunsoonleella flava TaxID=2527939 RepID=A0A4Q9FD85_9FLAO|nr:hypothetical protein [Hyunsoonleella flava]TBN03220.1 hypothetical protein EYD45_09395 [Hyunsoonleella flava]